MMKNKILVECYNDAFLFYAFGKSKYEVDHYINGGREEVFKNISKMSNCLGVVDFDKRIDDPYFNNNCKLLKQIANDIEIFLDKDKNNHILVFYKKLEIVLERIIKVTKSDSTASRLGLPIDWDGLHKLGEGKRSEYKNLCHTLIERSTELQQIKQYL